MIKIDEALRIWSDFYYFHSCLHRRLFRFAPCFCALRFASSLAFDHHGNRKNYIVVIFRLIFRLFFCCLLFLMLVIAFFESQHYGERIHAESFFHLSIHSYMLCTFVSICACILYAKLHKYTIVKANDNAVLCNFLVKFPSVFKNLILHRTPSNESMSYKHSQNHFCEVRMNELYKKMKIFLDDDQKQEMFHFASLVFLNNQQICCFFINLTEYRNYLGIKYVHCTHTNGVLIVRGVSSKKFSFGGPLFG